MLCFLKEKYPEIEIQCLDEDVYCIVTPEGKDDIVICVDEIFGVKENGELTHAFNDVTVSWGEDFKRFNNAEDTIAYICELLEKIY